MLILIALYVCCPFINSTRPDYRICVLHTSVASGMCRGACACSLSHRGRRPQLRGDVPPHPVNAVGASAV